MERARPLSGRVAVTFESPTGADVVVLQDGDVAPFGRGGQCTIRFGFAPTIDAAVPRMAGTLVVANQRVFVETTANPERPVPEVHVDGRPPVPVGVGAAYAPAEERFRVLVRGDRDWQLQVHVRREEAAPHVGDDPQTRTYELALTATQRKVLRAYLEPLRRGRPEPATHRQVADALGYHPNSAREVIYEVWSRMFAAAIPMPDHSDKRVAVVQTLLLHGLLP